MPRYPEHPEYPDTIIGALPDRDDEIVEDAPPDRLPLEIIGNLPRPPQASRHRIVNTNFLPDGVDVQCSCGWATGVQTSSAVAEMVFHQHLPG